MFRTIKPCSADKNDFIKNLAVVMSAVVKRADKNDFIKNFAVVMSAVVKRVDYM